MPVKYASAAVTIPALPPRVKSLLKAERINLISLIQVSFLLNVPTLTDGKAFKLPFVIETVIIVTKLSIAVLTLAQELGSWLLFVTGSAIIVKSFEYSWFVIANFIKSLALLKAITDWDSSPTKPLLIGTPLLKYDLVASIILAFPPLTKSLATAVTIYPMSLLHLDEPLKIVPAFSAGNEEILPAVITVVIIETRLSILVCISEQDDVDVFEPVSESAVIVKSL